ncbi:MAG: apolipoprotein N-acyltransferase [Pyrinomonadaceae bacterium]
MMKFPDFSPHLPNLKSILLSVISAILLVLAFPDFELWWMAWFALVPLLLALESNSVGRSLVLGWIFGITFFLGTGWWLTFAPITYAGFPAPLAYFLLLCVAVIAGFFPAAFAAGLSVCLSRFGIWAMFSAPFLWVAAEFARYWITGNNWNAAGYSQAFGGPALKYASIGGILLVSLLVVCVNALLAAFVLSRVWRPENLRFARSLLLALIGTLVVFGALEIAVRRPYSLDSRVAVARVIAIQPNVPMSGLTIEKWHALRERHIQLAESTLKIEGNAKQPPTIVIFPESPMNFRYEEEPEFREWLKGFASRNNVSVLFNAAEPDHRMNKYFNSAVLVDTQGNKLAQYDKIYLMPFGEAVPFPLQSIVPALVGSFSYGNEYDLIPLGDAKAGVMICFETHFADLSREFADRGADVIIELTNDGYLGPTPVLRQHLANAVFRAVEMNRPVLRVTNVGISAYIDERGRIIDPTDSYVEDTRVWNVFMSDGSQTFYSKYGDWIAWLSVLVSAVMLGISYRWRLLPKLNN